MSLLSYIINIQRYILVVDCFFSLQDIFSLVFSIRKKVEYFIFVIFINIKNNRKIGEVLKMQVFLDC